MTVETATKISQLNVLFPPGTDPKSEGDDHLRLIKSVLQACFDDSGTTLKTTLPIGSPAGGTVGGLPIATKTARTRNRLRNPVMQISQENSSTTVTSAGAYPADQWVLTTGGLTGPAATRVALGAVSPDGAQYGLSISVGTAKPSLAAGDNLLVVQPLEGLDIADLLWGTAAAKPIVLRFNALAATTGTYGFALRNGAANRSFAGSFTIATANVWQTFVFAIPGDTVGTWVKDSTYGVGIAFTYAAGTTYVGAAGWQAGNILAPPGCVNGAAIANSPLYVTDVGLYNDPDNTGLAPPFIPPAYEEDLARCQRYWQWVATQFWGSVTSGGPYLALGKVSPSMRSTVTFTGAVGISASSFGATPGTFSLFNQLGGGISENRNATATSVNAGFQSVVGVNSRLI